MQIVNDKITGGVIPGQGNYQAQEFNSAIKRELASLVLGTSQSGDANSFLQLFESFNRLGMVCSYYTQSAFSNNSYSLKYSGYEGQAIDPGLDPLAQPLVTAQTYNGVTEIKEGSIICFKPNSYSLSGTDITINISQASLSAVNVVAPDYGSTIFRSLDKENDFRVNEYVILLYEGAQFVVINTLINDLVALKNSGYIQVGFSSNTYIITSDKANPDQYYDGLMARWLPNNTVEEGGASLQIQGLPTVPLVRRDGLELNPYDVSSLETAVATYHTDKFYLDSIPVSRAKQGYDTATLCVPSTGGTAGTPSDTLFIIQPQNNSLSGNNLATYYTGGQHTIPAGTRIVSYVNGSNSLGGTIQLQIVKSTSIAQGTFPNVFPIKSIKQANGSDLAASSFNAGILYEFIYDGTDWIVLNSLSGDSGSSPVVILNLFTISNIPYSKNVATVTEPATGKYDITFTNPISSSATALATVVWENFISFQNIVNVEALTTTGCSVKVFDGGGALESGPFNLVIWENPPIS